MASSRPQTPSGNKDSENQPVSPRRDTDKGSGSPKDGGSDDRPPPLPPRAQKPPHGLPEAGLNPYSAAHKLQSGPTTALSLANVNVQALDDVNRENYVSLAGGGGGGGGGGPEKIVRPATSGTSRRGSRVGIDIGDNGSIRSFMPESDTPIDAGSVFGDFGGFEAGIPFRNASMKPGENQSIFNAQSREDDIAVEFEDEFDSVDNSNEGENEEEKLEKWRRKKKHFFILSSAGKPIYTRHGDGGLISPFIGIIQTIISFYQESGGPLKSFSAGKTKIVILSQGPLYLVAISSLFESQAHLRAQLEALYMQILSTLTLPALDHIFAQMEKNGSMEVLRVALEQGRPAPTDIVPGTVVRHFLYKSKANVQFTMSSYSPEFMSILDRRRLMSAYHSLHLSVHGKPANVKVQYCVSSSSNSLAWVTPIFELYCVASPNSNRNALSQGANKIAFWAQREQERLFIIGGASSTRHIVIFQACQIIRI
ncbi:vacuolar fusion protein mon1 [Trichophyton equinum CBS 127.97]|uniref:Vacuolar fusion protein MON1 n=1 Tax=Trichophyton equinum (strain ATCC MYA-4606 / CBS 127.97) TaxID=559882 RepID=F2PNN6_TRIEC|nr:vacuolar fusion protein mon1 [Trichophyton equinum CBS 127.97]